MHSDTFVTIRRWLELVCLISTFQEGAFALVFKSVHYPGEAVGTRWSTNDVRTTVHADNAIVDSCVDIQEGKSITNGSEK